MSHAQWGVVVRSLDTGELLYARNPHKVLMPASNMKIVTVAGAAHLLGWDARFTTTIETAAAVRAGVLQGDLFVRGGGDPTLNARHGGSTAVFDEWAAALRAAGIEAIDGHVVADGRLFDEVQLGSGWAWDDLQYGYAAPIGALQLDENVVELTVSPGPAPGQPAIIHLAPESGLTIWNHTVTTAAGIPESIEYHRRLDQPVLEIRGSVPLPLPQIPGGIVQERSVVRKVAVVDPTLFFARSLKHALVARGIAVSGDAVVAERPAVPGVALQPARPAASGEALEPGRSPGSGEALEPGRSTASGEEPDPGGIDSTVREGASRRRVLARTESPPFREIARVLLKESQNLYAESILKSVGAAASGAGTTAAGRDAVLAVLRDWGIGEDAIAMADGSGMSRYNYVSPDALVRILERMYTESRHREPFSASLAIAGRDGTLASRLRGTRAEGNAVAKTGTLSNVRALSGYLRTRDGEMLVFSIVANNFVIPGPTVTWITDLAVAVLSNFTRPSSHRGPLHLASGRARR